MTLRPIPLALGAALATSLLVACGSNDPVETSELAALDSPQAAIDYFDAGGFTDVDGAKVQKRIASTVGEDSWSDDGTALARALVLAGGQTDATVAGQRLAAQTLRVAADHGKVAPKVRVALGRIVAAHADSLLQLGNGAPAVAGGFDLTTSELRDVGHVVSGDSTASAVGIAGLTVQRGRLLASSLEASARQGTSLASLRQDQRLESALTSAGEGYGAAVAAFLDTSDEPEQALTRGVAAADSVGTAQTDLVDAVHATRSSAGRPELVLRVGVLDLLLSHGFLQTGEGAAPRAALAKGSPVRLDPALYDGDVDNAPAAAQDAFTAWLDQTAPLDVATSDATGYSRIGGSAVD